MDAQFVQLPEIGPMPMERPNFVPQLSADPSYAAAYADERVFSKGRWHFPDEESRTIHYQAGGAFFATGEAFQVVKA